MYQVQHLSVRLLVMEPAHPGSIWLGIRAHIFLDLFPNLTDVILLVIGNVPVNSEMLVVTSSISQESASTQPIEYTQV